MPNNEIDIITVEGVDNDVKDTYTRTSIAGTETTSIASKNYSKNELLYLASDRSLYEVIEDIESGDTLSSGVNIAKKSISDILLEKGNKSVVLTGILPAGTASITFTDSSINDESLIEVFTDVYGVSIVDISQSGTSVTITFKPRITDTWETKTWYGYSGVVGTNIWTDGDNIYFSYTRGQYVLDKSTSTWSTKTWNGYSQIQGPNVWTDGDNIYYSKDNNQYVLDKSTSTWSTKTWNNAPQSFLGENIWTDGDNIYYSNGSDQYVLDKSTSTWSAKTWNGYSSLYSVNIWTDGDNIYYSAQNMQYVLDKSTSTWNAKTWNGFPRPIGMYIWTDGDNIYNSIPEAQYVLDKSTSTWSAKTWKGFYDSYGPSGMYIWTDGDNIYYSDNSYQYKLLSGNTKVKLVVTKED